MASSDRVGRVAVVGAGLAGAVCAQQLSLSGWRVQVFDKSRGAGGRLATRRAQWQDAQGQSRTHEVRSRRRRLCRHDAGLPGVRRAGVPSGWLASWLPVTAPGHAPPGADVRACAGHAATDAGAALRDRLLLGHADRCRASPGRRLATAQPRRGAAGAVRRGDPRDAAGPVGHAVGATCTGMGTACRAGAHAAVLDLDGGGRRAEPRRRGISRGRAIR